MDKITHNVGGVYRPSGEILTDVVEVLQRLKIELAMLMDEETRELIGRVERNSFEIILNKGKWKKSRKDPDGDVRVVGGEVTQGNRAPESRSEEDDHMESHEEETRQLSLKEMNAKMKMMEGMLTSLQWRRVDEENALEDRLGLLEARMATLEVVTPKDDPWIVVSAAKRKPAREASERPITRGITHRVETRMEVIAGEHHQTRERVGVLEKRAEEGIKWRGIELDKLEARVHSLEMDMYTAGKAIVGLKAKDGLGFQRHKNVITVEKKPVEFRPSRSMFDQSLVIYGKFETGGYLSCPKQATGPNWVTLISQVTLGRLIAFLCEIGPEVGHGRK